jgi:hypothetical protein
MTGEYFVDQVFNDLDSIKKTKNKFIDGLELHTALLLKMLVGLKKKEISKAKISNLRSKNGIPVGINMGREIQFSKNFSFEIDKYLKNRNSKLYDQSPDSPLFPKYHGANKIRNLERDLKKCLNEIDEDHVVWNLHHLKEAGIINHYHKCLEHKGRSEEDCIKETAGIFDVKPRTVNENLQNRKSVKPTALDKFFKHSEKHTEYNFSNASDVAEYQKIGLDLIDKSNKIKKSEKENIIKNYLQAIEKYKDASKKAESNKKQLKPKNNFADMIKRGF